MTFIPPYDDELVMAVKARLPMKFYVNGAMWNMFLLLWVVVA
jgi:hypothetical protein